MAPQTPQGVSAALSCAGFIESTHLGGLGFQVRTRSFREGEAITDAEVSNTRGFRTGEGAERAMELDQWADALEIAGYEVKRYQDVGRTYLLKIYFRED